MDRQQLSSKELSRQMEPVAARLREFTEPMTGDGSLPAVQQLVPVASQIAVLVGNVLSTTGDPYGTGRRNLQSLRERAHRLGELADAALRDEPGVVR